MQIKKWLAATVSGLLLFTLLPMGTSFADSNDDEDSKTQSSSGDYTAKDEVIYGNLKANGKTKDMYIVNSFDITESGEIIDYGDYNDVRNLTDLSDIEQTDDKIQFQANKDEFYYQGELDKMPLPWDLAITYLLDGKKVSPDELAGESGDLEIQISTSANEDVDKVFFENYLLQISLTLDPLIFKDIQAPEGTEANEGKNKQISFMILPEKEEELILTANVDNMELDPIDITAIPANIAIDSPDLSNVKGDMESLSDGIRDVNSGVIELKDGISELNSGAQELGRGSTDYQNGVNELNQSSGELVNGSAEIRNALNTISESMSGEIEMPDLSELKELPAGLREMASGLREAATGIGTLKENYDVAHNELNEAIKEIPDYDINEEKIQKLYESGADKEVIDQLVDMYTEAKTVKGTHSGVEEGFNKVSETLGDISNPIEEVADQLDGVASEAEEAMKNMDQLDDLTDLQNGLSSLSSEYKSFHNGLVEYTDGVGSLASSYNEFNDGVQGLANSTPSLLNGANELQNGTEELREETSDLPNQLESQVEEMLEEFENKDFEPKSFVSEQNEDVDVVQFVLKTEAIEVEEPETNEDEDEEPTGIWEKFLDLFK